MDSMIHNEEIVGRVITNAAALRERVAFYKSKNQRIAFVPTMGSLHKGHLSLVRHAKASSDIVITSIFVNPKQFGPNEDFDSYPRDHASDVELLREEGCHFVYIPEASDIYPEGFSTVVSLPSLDGVLCGASRPGFFTGIATVLTRLFLQIDPDAVFFGEKDYQQLMLVRRLVADLGLKIDVEGCPIIREEDGLAMSSRNRYLTDQERQLAPNLYQQMQSVLENKDDLETALENAKIKLKELGFEVDYFEVRDIEALEPVTGTINQPARLFAAAMLGKTRLIDNMEIMPNA